MPRVGISRGVALVAAATVVVLLASAHRYGHHRDELYFIAIGQHPSWGFVDQPSLVPLLAAAMDSLGDGSLTVLRLPSALAIGGVVTLAALMAREFGGNGRARLVAAAATAASSFPIAVGHLVSTSTYDLLWWSLLSWLLVRAIRDGGHHHHLLPSSQPWSVSMRRNSSSATTLIAPTLSTTASISTTRSKG